MSEQWIVRLDGQISDGNELYSSITFFPSLPALEASEKLVMLLYCVQGKLYRWTGTELRHVGDIFLGEGTELIDNLETTIPGKGALDARQGNVVAKRINKTEDIIKVNQLITTLKDKGRL